MWIKFGRELLNTNLINGFDIRKDNDNEAWVIRAYIYLDVVASESFHAEIGAQMRFEEIEKLLTEKS
jgi:hypothetical protein